MRILMLGPPGSGKGTQGVRIAETFGIDHISSGDLLRAAVDEDTPLGREVAGYMARGELAPDELVAEAIRPVLQTREGGYVLDGFPRSLTQSAGLTFDAVVYLHVPRDVVTRRLLSRRRLDDTTDVIVRRLREYADETRPLIDFYRTQGVLVEIDGDRPPDEITAALLARLQPQLRAHP